MPFPSTPREIYDVNPLNEVICQLRYPTILKISSETPSQFQDAVRAKYSKYSTNSNPSGLGLSGLGFQMPPEIADALKSVPLFAMGGVAEHHFSVEDESRLISLTQEFITLTERQYSRWEEFRAELVSMAEIFRQVYEPGPYNRIGLRYVDVLMRSQFGLPDTPWSEFLNPSFIGLLGDEHVANDVRELLVECTLTIPDVEGGRVHIKHGLRRTEEENEQVYLIDADFHTGWRSDQNGAFEVLDKFNQWSGSPRGYVFFTPNGEVDEFSPKRIAACLGAFAMPSSGVDEHLESTVDQYNYWSEIGTHSSREKLQSLKIDNVPFSYSSFGSPGQLHQGEVLFGIQEYQPEHPGKRLTAQDNNLDGQLFDRKVVVVTSECDLIGDYAARMAMENGDLNDDEKEKQEARLLAHVHLCEVFDESEIKEPLPKGSDLWRNVRTNQNIRYHMVPEASIAMVPEAPIAEVEEKINPAFYLDFKRMFSVPANFLYTSLQCDEIERRGVMPSPWVDSLIDRLFHFHGRVCVPDPSDNRLTNVV